MRPRRVAPAVIWLAAALVGMAHAGPPAVQPNFSRGEARVRIVPRRVGIPAADTAETATKVQVVATLPDSVRAQLSEAIRKGVRPPHSQAKINDVRPEPKGSDPFSDSLAEGELAGELAERWLRLALVDRETGQAGPAILGSYRHDGGMLVFVPRHSLVPGLRYRASLFVSDTRTIDAEYEVPAGPSTPPAIVEAIHPSADVLPANLLKFYIHFSKPMREGRAIFDLIRIIGPNGPIEGAWRETELWSADGRRLTLYIHPGRIKRGIDLGESMGPVLEPNRRYQLIVPAELCDAEGQRLGRSFVKEFATGPEDRSRPLPETWEVRPPTAGTRQPLRIRMPDPLDRLLIERQIDVYDPQGRLVRGQVTIEEQESAWSLVPETLWGNGAHSIRVGPDLEDLAGNTPNRLFDTDLSEPAPPPARLVLPFTTRSDPSIE